MPARDMDYTGVPAVAPFASLLNELVDEAAAAKQTTTIEPALNKTDLDNLSQRVAAVLPDIGEAETADVASDASKARDAAKARRNAVVETAARDLFSNTIVWTPHLFSAGLKLMTLGDHSDRLSGLRENMEPDGHPVHTLR